MLSTTTRSLQVARLLLFALALLAPAPDAALHAGNKGRGKANSAEHARKRRKRKSSDAARKTHKPKRQKTQKSNRKLRRRLRQRLSARAQTTRSAVRAARELDPMLNPALRKNAALLGRVDRFITGLHMASKKARLQLTGSSLYRSIGALDRRIKPSFHDLDLRVSGLSLEQVIDVVVEHFPEVDPAKDITRGVQYHPAVEHYQVAIHRPGGEVQLDISLYSSEKVDAPLDRPHQWVTLAKLKLEIPRGQVLSQLLARATRFSRAKGMRELRDPSGTGVADLSQGRVRVFFERGMPRARRLEGLIHAMYLVGKSTSYSVATDTIDYYRRAGSTSVVEFFRHPRAEVARLRTGYLLGLFRVNRHRHVHRILHIGRQTRFWVDLFPALGPVATRGAAWRRLSKLVERAHAEAVEGNGRTRAYVLGALLAPLTPRQFERARKRLKLPERRSPVTGLTWSEDLEQGYDDYRAEWLHDRHDRR